MPKKQSTNQNTHEHAGLSGWFWLSAAILIAVKLWLARGLTFNGIGYMSADDQLFINQANAILSGDWLGAYNFLTLFKGPFYPLYIAASSILGIPLLTGQQILYAAACLAVCLALAPLLHRQYLLVILLGVLLFNPMSVTNTVATRVLREGIYPALTLLSLAGAIGLVLQLEKPLRCRIVWLLLFGFSLSAFWLTREERIWILPSLIILTCLAIYRIRTEKCCNWRQALVNLLIPAAMLGAAILTICGLNLQHYGIFVITEYDSPVFLKAYGSLTRVKPANWQPLIPVSVETRERIYAVSPSFSQLKPWLEGDIGLLYSRYGENVKNDNREMGGGWFHMALRESIDRAGLTSDGKFPTDYYRQLASEIDSACASGVLECGPSRSSFMAVWNNAYLKPLVQNSWTALKYLVDFEGYDGELRDCLGTEDQLNPFITITHEKCWHTNLSVLIKGWVVKPGEVVSVWIYDDTGTKIISPTTHSLSQDLLEHFTALNLDASEAATARFQLEADCPTGCTLIVKGDDGRVIEAINLIDPGSFVDTPDNNGLYYQLESVDWRTGDELTHGELYRIDLLKSRVLMKLSSLYQTVFPMLAVLAFFIYIYQTIELIRKRGTILHWGIETCLLVAIGTRLAMVAWLETSSINAIITTYLSPIYPILILFIIIAFIWLILILLGELPGGPAEEKVKAPG
jgi:hypothetical protein